MLKRLAQVFGILTIVFVVFLMNSLGKESLTLEEFEIKEEFALDKKLNNISNYETQIYFENLAKIHNSTESTLMEDTEVNKKRILEQNQISFSVIANIVDKNGQPLSQAKGVLDLKDINQVRTAYSDSNGKLEFRGTIPQAFKIQGTLTVSKQMYKQAVFTNIILYDGNGYDQNVGTMKLEGGFKITVSGEVDDVSGNALSDIPVDLYIDEYHDQKRSSTTGQFEFSAGIDYKESYNAKVKAGGKYYEDQTKEVYLNSGNEYKVTNIQFNLKRKLVDGKVTGSVTGAKDFSELNAILEINGKKENHQVDLRGEFSFDVKGMNLGQTYKGTLKIENNEGTLVNKDVELNESNNYQQNFPGLPIQFVMYDLIITGRVTSQATSNPIKDVRVKVDLTADKGSVNKEVITDNDGRYRITESVRKGEYSGSLAFSKEDLLSQSFQINLSGQNRFTTEKNVELVGEPVTVKISGNVVEDANRKPIKDAKVEIAMTYPKSNSNSVSTDDSGNFQWTQELQKGVEYKFEVSVSKAYFFSSKKEIILNKQNSFNDNLSFSLKENRSGLPMKVTGQVIQSSTRKPIEGVNLQMGLDSEDGPKSYSSKSDSNGNFEFSGYLKEGFKYTGTIKSNKENYQNTETRIELEMNSDKQYNKNIGIINLNGNQIDLKFDLSVIEAGNSKAIENAKIDFSVKSEVDGDEQAQTQNTLSNGIATFSGKGEYGRSFEIKSIAHKQYFLDKSTSDKLTSSNDYKSSQWITLTRKNVEMRIGGKVIHQLTKQGIPNVSVKSDISKLESKEVKTDENGNFVIPFDGQDGLEYEGSVSLNKDNYKTPDSKPFKLNTQNSYKNHLGEIEMSGVLISANLKGKIVDGISKSPVEGTKVQIKILKPIEKEHLAYTTSDGDFTMDFGVQFGAIYEGSLNTESKDYFPVTRSFSLSQEGNYKTDVGSIPLYKNFKQGEISGKLVDSFDNSPIVNQKVVYSQTSPEAAENVAYTDGSGNFGIFIRAKKGETYAGTLSASRDYFNPLSTQINLNEQNSFKNQLGEIKMIRMKTDAHVIGIIKDSSNRKLLDHMEITLEITKPEARSFHIKGSGDFKVDFHAYQGLVYQGTLNLKRPFYDSVSKSVILNKDSNYVQNFETILMDRQAQKGSIFGKVIGYHSLAPINKVSIEIKLASKDLQIHDESLNQVCLFEFSPRNAINYAESSEITLNIESDENGQFTVPFDGLKGKEYNGYLVTKKENFKQKSVSVYVGPKNAYNDDLGIIKLVRVEVSSFIKGYIYRKSTEKPLNDIKVELDFTIPNESHVSTQTNQEGYFEFYLKEEKGKVYQGNLIVNDKNYKPLNKPVKLDQFNNYQEDVGILRIEGKDVAMTIYGALTNSANSKTLENAILKIKQTSPNSKEYSEIKSDFEGKYEFKDNNEYGLSYKYNVEGSLYGFKTANFDTELVKENKYTKNLDIKMERKYIDIETSGIVVHSKDKTPLSNAIVTSNIDDHTTKATKTDEKGNFYIKQTIPQKKTYNQVIIVEKENYNRNEKKEIVSEDNNYQVSAGTITLTGKDTKLLVTGLVQDDSSTAPLPNSRVDLSIGNENTNSQRFIKTVSTDADGKYSIESHLEYGVSRKLYLTFNHENYNELNLEAKVSSLTGYENFINAKMSRESVTMKVKGLVLHELSLKPILEANVKISLQTPIAKDFLLVTDERGKFYKEIEGKKGLVYDGLVYFTKTGYNSNQQDLKLEISNNYFQEFKAKLAGQTNLATIDGIVIDEETNTVINDAKVNAKITSPYTEVLQAVQTDSQGKFHFEKNLQFGEEYTVRLSVHKDLYGVAHLVTTLNPENSYKTNVRLVIDKNKAYLLLEGTVVQESTGKPLSDVDIELKSQDQVIGNAKTSKRGFFHLSKVIKRFSKIEGVSTFSKTDFTTVQKQSTFDENDNYTVELGKVLMKGKAIEGLISGKVTDKSGGLLEGAKVAFKQIDPKAEDLIPVYTSSEGLYSKTLNLEYNVFYDFEVIFSKDHYKQIFKDTELSPKNSYKAEVNSILFRGKKQGKISGQVFQGSTQLPILKVLAIASLEGVKDTYSSHSDNEGNFELNVPLDEGKSYKTDIVFHKNHYQNVTKSGTLTPENSYTQILGKVYMNGEPVLLRVSGSVLSSNNNPLNNVQIDFKQTSPNPLDYKSVFSDQEGRYQFSENGEFNIKYTLSQIASKPNFSPVSKTLDLNQDFSYTKVNDIIMERKQEKMIIKGKVIQATTQNPLSGVKVVYNTKRDGIEVPEVSATTDSNGEFKLEKDLAMRNEIQGDIVISKPRFQKVTKPITLNQKNEYQINAGTIEMVGERILGKISGIVKEKANNSPLSAVQIDINSYSPTRIQKKEFTVSDGTFSSSIDMEYGIEYKFAISITKSDFDIVQLSKVLNSENNYEINLEVYLEREGTLGEVLGRAVQATDGTPLNNVESIVSINSPEYQSSTVISNEEGKFVNRIKVLKGKEYTGTITLKKENYEKLKKNIQLGETSNNYKLDLGDLKLYGKQVKCMISGITVDKETSNRISDITIELLERIPEDKFIATTKSDSQGEFKFEFNCQYSVSYEFILNTQSHSYKSLHKKAELKAANSYKIDLGKLELEKRPKGAIEGVVRNSVTKNPIPQASVNIEIKDISDSDSSPISFSLQTNEYGYFYAKNTIKSGHAYQATFKVKKEGFEDKTEDGYLNEKSNYVLHQEILLKPKVIVLKIEGKIRNSESLSLEDVNVKVKVTSKTNSYDLETTTNSNGEFSIKKETELTESFSCELVATLKKYEDYKLNFFLEESNKFHKLLDIILVSSAKKVIGHRKINGRVFEYDCKLNRYLPAKNFRVRLFIKSYVGKKNYPTSVDKSFGPQFFGIFEIGAPVFADNNNKILEYTGIVIIKGEHSDERPIEIKIDENWNHPLPMGIIKLYNPTC